MFLLLLSLNVWLISGVLHTSKYAACNLDPHCRQIANLSADHTTVMALITEDRIECKLEGLCPVKTPSITGARTPCVGGQAAGYQCSNVDLLAFVSLSDLGCNSCEGNDIWGWTDPSDGNLYAIAGTTVGTSIVRVTDPENPVPVVWIPSYVSTATIWRDMKVDQNWLYIVADRSGQQMQYFDLTRVRGRNSLSTLQPDGIYSISNNNGGNGRCHNIVINEGTHAAYLVGNSGCAGGLYSVDVSTPGVPIYRGCFSSDGYTHDAECVNYQGPDSRYTGREICFGYNENTLTIVDYTNPTSPSMISRTPYTGAAYTHQGWLSDTPLHAFLFLDDELDEQRRTGGNTGRARTYLVDVRDLQNPNFVGHHDQPVMGIDHNLYVKGSYVYEANYEAGLRILSYFANINTGQVTVNEVGFFDTYPEGNNVVFNGAWSNYPYFDNFVVLQDINRGLFILQATNLDPALAKSPNATRF